jgi:hypothetical protein
LDDDRFIYFNEDWSVQDPFKVSLTNNDCAPNLLEQVDCKKTLWYPEIAYPCISTKVVSGGNKLPGKYSYLFSFATYDGTPLGTYKALTQGTSIFRRGKTDSNKSINVTISNITTTSRYRYYNLVAAQTVKGATTYKLVGTYSVNQTTVIDSDNTGTAISLQEILTQYPYYMNSGDVTISNNILFKTNVREYPKMNLQNIISQIKLKWVTTVLKEGDYAKPEISEDYRSFLRDEIYPLGFEFVTTNGETIASGVLVGRAAQPGDLNPITNADVVKEDSCDVLNKPYWKVYNTATREFRDSRTPETIYNTCSIGDTIYERGEFAYWESTEVYPNNPFVWGNLCGKPIRHFKFPDHIQTLHHSTTTGSVNYIFPLGVEVQTDIDQLLNNSVSNGAITQEQRNRIAGWRLIRGNRINNRSVIAKGLLYHVWEYERQSLDPNFGVCTTNGIISGVNTIIDSSIWVNTGGTYCLNGNLYQNQTDQFGATRVNLVTTADPSCVEVIVNNADADGDGIANTTDPDDDNDGILDVVDNRPLDTDNDGIDNVSDSDDDGDDILDVLEAPGQALDTDNDGTPNNLDADDDNDGTSDLIEQGTLAIGTLLPDADFDGRPDLLDVVVTVPPELGVGAIRWDLWHENINTTNSLNPQIYHDRVPFFGQELSPTSVLISGASQSIIDQEIAYAKNAGLSFFAFYWYERFTSQNVTSPGNYFYARELFKTSTSPDKAFVKAAYILSRNIINDSHWNNVNSTILTQIGADMLRSDYHKVTIDGVVRPLLFYHASDGNDTIQPYQRANLVTAYRMGNPTAPEPYIVNMIETGAAQALASLSSDKAQAMSNYNTGGNASTSHTFASIVEDELVTWNRYNDANCKVVPIVSVGFDRRPRIDNPVPWESPTNTDWTAMGTPSEIASHLQTAVNFVRDNPVNCESKTIIIYAWNEHDEGGFICPTIIPGTSNINTAVLDAIKNVLIT